MQMVVWWSSVLAALALLSVQPAAAAVFREVDRSVQQQATAVAPPPQNCAVSGSNDLDFDSTPTQLYAGSTSRSDVSGTACAAQNSNNIVIITLSAVIEGGVDGTPVQLCAVATHVGTTAASVGDVLAEARIGGFPLGNPGEIRVNGAAVLSQLAAFSMNQRGGDTTRLLVTAAIGDTVTLLTSTQSIAAVDGAGSASAFASGRLELHIGACPIERAPAASPIGLAALALALLAAGASRARR